MICIIGLLLGFVQVGVAESSEVKEDIPLNAKALLKQVPKKAVKFNIFQASKAARAWLKLMDDKEYGKCWAMASPMIKKVISEKAFIDQAERSRQPLGTFKKREVVFIEPKTELPGAPKGQYVLITFKSQFNNKQEGASEMLMMQREQDNVWRVAAYFIH